MTALRWVVLIAVLGVACWCGYLYYEHQLVNPTTNDAYVEANYAGLAAQVSGPIIAIHARDNQRVKKGDLLVEIDPAPFAIAVDHARALVDRIRDENSELSAAADVNRARVVQRTAELGNATDLHKRIEPMARKNYMSQNRLEASLTAVETATATLRQAEADVVRAESALGEEGDRNARLRIARADLAKAELNLSYTRIYAPCDGFVTNFRWTVGGYVNAGHPLFAVVDDSQWWIYAYFRENQIQHMKNGQSVDMKIVTYGNRVFKGRVEGIGYGIFQPDGATIGLLPKVSPEVDWVKLAQRFPVRIVFEGGVPPVQMRIGSSAVVTVKTGRGSASN
ncbi:MAG: HlyD family secretion protein [Myxococcota bacterium]